MQVGKHSKPGYLQQQPGFFFSGMTESLTVLRTSSPDKHLSPLFNIMIIMRTNRELINRNDRKYLTKNSYISGRL